MAGDPEELETTSDSERPNPDGDTVDGDPVEMETPLAADDGNDIVANARRRFGSGGALLAAGMLGLDNLLREKVKPDSVQVQEAPTDPIDLDADGIQVTIDEQLSVSAPALERTPLLDIAKKRRRS